MPITMFYAGALALVYLALSVRVIQGRGKGGPNLGDGGNPEMLRRIRGHGNFQEYVPLLLILMALLERRGLNGVVLHAMGMTLLVARILHGYALSYTEKFFLGRFVGTAATLLLLGVGGILCIVYALRAFSAVGLMAG